MLTESESRLWGGLLTAIGTAAMCCGLIRWLVPAADWSLYVASAGIGFGLPLLVAGWKWLGSETQKASVSVRLDQARAWASELANREREARLDAPAPAPAAVPVLVTRQAAYNTPGGASVIEMQEKRPARWVAWQALALGYLDWVRLRGGATSGLLVGPEAMFGERGQWVDATNGLRDAGMIEKVNGRSTEIPSVDALLARVREGKFEWPADREPPAWRPCPVEVRAVSATPA